VTDRPIHEASGRPRRTSRRAGRGTDRPSAPRVTPARILATTLLALVLVVTGGMLGTVQPTTAAWTDSVVTQGQIDVAPIPEVTDVVAGRGFSCLLASGEVWCTGDNSVGQLGTGDTTSSDVFVGPVRGELAGKTVTQVDAGTSHVCAATTDALYCWGQNDQGQLGVTGIPSSPLPVLVPAESDHVAVTDLEAGATSTCAVAAGKAYCWGETHTAAGRTGIPVQITGGALPAGATVTDVAVGESSACLVADGLPYCWGSNGRGQLGDGTTTTSRTPVAVAATTTLAGFTSSDVSVGAEFACVVASASENRERTFCWGDNTSQQLGQSSNGAQVQMSTTPLQVRGALTELRSGFVDLGDRTACVLAYDGAVYCWGDNSSGQTGANEDEWSTPAVRDRPERILSKKMGSDNVLRTVDVSVEHGCSLATGGSVYCWGSNAAGQLGIEGAAGAGQRKVFPWPATSTWSKWGGAT
jgi:alpha-tubulin suppressor-like RCC1 family protein